MSTFTHKIFWVYLVASLRYGTLKFYLNFPFQFGAIAIFCRSKSRLIKKFHKIDPPKVDHALLDEHVLGPPDPMGAPAGAPLGALGPPLGAPGRQKSSSKEHFFQNL